MKNNKFALSLAGSVFLCLGFAGFATGETSVVPGASAVPAVPALVLAERGRPAAYTIVVPANPGEALQYAAEELRDWTEQLTGVRLAIETAAKVRRGIYLGGTEEGLGPDGFHVYAKDGDIYVHGSAERGVLYGVYELLETYGGISWFTSSVSDVPATDRFALPATLDDRQIPVFEMRDPFFYDINYHPEFAARLRKNAALWTHLPKKYGGDRFRAGAGLRGHTFSIVMPVEKYFDAHPEYFAEVNGQRQRVNTQLCLTNPDVLKIFTENLLALAAKDHDDCLYYAVYHDDNRTVCQCANCRQVLEEEGSASGLEVRFANQVAAALEKVYPDKLVKVSAYETTRRPPKKTKARHNVFVDLAPIECDYSRPIPESDYKMNREFCEDIVGWSKVCDRIFIFDYVTCFRDYFHPFQNVYSLKGNLKFYLDHGVTMVCSEGVHDTPHGDLAELKTWLLAKLMWNPDQDVDALIDRFLVGYYGKAAPFVRTYIEELHKVPRDATNPLLIGEKFYEGLPDEFLDRMLKVWRDAEEAVKDDPARRRRVRVGALSVTMTVLQRNGYRFCAMSRPFPDKKIRTLAKFSLSTLDSLGYDVHCEELGRVAMEKMKGLWRRYLDPAFERPPADTVVVEAEDAFTIWGGFKTGVEPDPTAAGGKALRYSNQFSGDWVTYLPVECFGHDKGATYHVRARVRIDRKPDAVDCELLNAGWIPVGIKTEVSTVGVDGAYRWIDLFDWTPDETGYLYLAPGRFDKTKYIESPAFTWLWVDQLEFKKVVK